jgi:hypothetical protein
MIYTLAWLGVSLTFEALGDIATKRAYWVAALFAYNLMLGAWFLAVRNVGVITWPGTVWLTGGQLALVAVGCGMFGEVLSFAQMIGCGFALVALILLSSGG